MATTAGCFLGIEVSEPTRATLSVAVAGRPTTESLTLLLDGQPLAVRELAGHHGTRLHVADLPVGYNTVRYDVELDPAGGPCPVTELDALEALRPSRYAPSDALAPWALREFGREPDAEAVVEWVNHRLDYDGSASRPVDSAVDTLLTGRGVCRDFAHLVVTALRSLDVPARIVSAYAPGLWPMDFHAVAEVAIDGVWQVFDATRLAPRPTLVRIATGLDAEDTAFLTFTGGTAVLTATEVWASTDAPLPPDGPASLA